MGQGEEFNSLPKILVQKDAPGEQEGSFSESSFDLD